MNDEIDRLRRENGWKPRKRGKSQVLSSFFTNCKLKIIKKYLNYNRQYN